MSDEHPTLPLPDPGARWVLSSDAAVSTDAAASAPEPQRKRRWPWLVALIAVFVLAVAAWFAGEYIARGIVERTIREQITKNLDLPVDQQIHVDVPGAILPALLVGSLPQVTISSADVPLNGITADVVVSAQDVPIRGGDWSGAHVTATLDAAQVQALLSRIDGFPASTVTLGEPDIDISMDLKLFALTVPVGVGLTPSASAGKLVLTPDTLQVAGAEVSAEVLVDQFGAIARTVVRDWEVCIAQDLPAAMTLTGVQVKGQAAVAEFEVDSSILHEGSARTKGTCS